jgi:hypothetical protein
MKKQINNTMFILTQMKNSMMLLFLSLIFMSAQKQCKAQTPAWVTTLASNNLNVSIAQITHWEEQQMTWYNINGQADGADSVRVNTLYVEGTTSSGNKFIGAIPVSGQEVNPLGSRLISGQSCTSQCGCQCCKFTPSDYGCFCDKEQRPDCCEDQGTNTCKCWCQHSMTSGQ